MFKPHIGNERQLTLWAVKKSLKANEGFKIQNAVRLHSEIIFWSECCSDCTARRVSHACGCIATI